MKFSWLEDVIFPICMAFVGCMAGAGIVCLLPVHAQDKTVKADSMGNGGWYTAYGTIRGVYVCDNIYNIIMEGDNFEVFTIPLVTPYPHYAPPIAAGEHVRFEFGGRAEGYTSVFTAYKVFRLPLPKVEAAHVEPLSCQCVHACDTKRTLSRFSRHRRHSKRSRRSS